MSEKRPIDCENATEYEDGRFGGYNGSENGGARALGAGNPAERCDRIPIDRRYRCIPYSISSLFYGFSSVRHPGFRDAASAPLPGFRSLGCRFPKQHWSGGDLRRDDALVSRIRKGRR
jgi:hypothetical protein